MEPSWLLYLGIALGPFVQEDAAVLAAATLSASDPQHFPNVFIFILIGLILLYTVIIFIACHYLGEIVGDKLEMMLPLIGGVFLLIFGAIIVWRYRMAKKHTKTP